ncbi:Protein translation factor SUI1 -like protein [Capsicum chinense]|nr:Protein translation factor SUI1 -like protein [Capsicum chinense]
MWLVARCSGIALPPWMRPGSSLRCGGIALFSSLLLIEFKLLNQAIYMVDIEVQISSDFDPSHSMTVVQGLRKEFSYKKILKDLKKEFCCNENVVQDKDLGIVIQLQGDQRKNVSHFLVTAGVVKKNQIKIHGF